MAGRASNSRELVPELVQFLFVQLFKVQQLVTGFFCHVDKFVELDLKRFGISVLGVLNEEHHEKRDDGRARVDDQLPSVAELE